MSTVLKTTIGPHDHGQPMSLAEFERAEFVTNGPCELGRGVIAVNDVPKPSHLRVLRTLRRQLNAYELERPDFVKHVAGGGESRLVVDDLESSRHPDLAVYLTEAPHDGRSVWSEWIPELVVEVVSPSSRYRDFEEKPEEYLRFGVKEYWIVDPRDGALVVLRRRGGRWARTDVRPLAAHETPLFPGLRVETVPIFAAAGPAEDHAEASTGDG